VDGRRAIFLNFRKGARLHHYHHGPRVRVPSGSSSRLRYQLGLHRIAGSLHVQNDILIGAGALCRLEDLQPDYLGAHSARAVHAGRERGGQRGRANSPPAVMPGVFVCGRRPGELYVVMLPCNRLPGCGNFVFCNREFLLTYSNRTELD